MALCILLICQLCVFWVEKQVLLGAGMLLFCGIVQRVGFLPEQEWFCGGSVCCCRCMLSRRVRRRGE